MVLCIVIYSEKVESLRVGISLYGYNFLSKPCHGLGVSISKLVLCGKRSSPECLDDSFNFQGNRRRQSFLMKRGIFLRTLLT